MCRHEGGNSGNNGCIAHFHYGASMAELSPLPEQPALDQAIEQYIRSHPEVIVQAVQSWQMKRQEEEGIRVAQAIAAHQKELLGDPASPVSGNAEGGVTVIEFLDLAADTARGGGGGTRLQKTIQA